LVEQNSSNQSHSNTKAIRTKIVRTKFEVPFKPKSEKTKTKRLFPNEFNGKKSTQQQQQQQQQQHLCHSAHA
jgi:hypothetical protein